MTIRTRRILFVFAFATLLAAGRAVLAADPPATVEYRAVEDVVYGQKDGMGLTLDVLTPKENAKGIGIILVSSGSWRSAKSNVLEQEERRRKGEHWVQGLLKGGYTLFLARHGSGATC